jgi:prepilin-type N-terminal cleavage/methylation domain-containing protein
MNKGFTLIELSIVLVIIGLLIGGVLVAQSLISSTKISSQISQIQQFDTALANFETKYNGLPGDSNIFSVTGDNDGRIEGFSGLAAEESILFWNHLSLSGLKTHRGAGDNYSSSGTNGIVITGSNANSPEAVLGENTAVVPQLDTGNYTDNGHFLNYYTFANCAGVTNNSTSINSCRPTQVSGSDIIALDVKLDDGAANSGQMRATVASQAGFYQITDNDGFGLNPDHTEATFIIRMGTRTGNPK